MTEPRPGLWSRIPLPVLAVVVIVVAIAVGIPIGLASGSEDGSGSSPDPSTTGPYPTSTSSTYPIDEPTEPTEPTESTEPESTESTEPDSTEPDSTEPDSTEPDSTEPDSTEPESTEPSGLSSAQAELWRGLEMAGVDRESCAGYPDGEQLDGVVTSLECTVQDSSISEPVVYYQFAGASAVAAYLELRGGEIDRTGDCDQGDETEGPWSVDGTRVGSYVCVDNVKNGTTYFKIAFSNDRDATVVVVQDESAADVTAWWDDHAAGQFYGVGNR